MNLYQNRHFVSPIARIVRQGLAGLMVAAGCLGGGRVVAQVTVVDTPSAFTAGTNVISAPVTASAGANVLVVLLASKGGGSGSGGYTDPATLTWNGQTLTQAASGYDNASTYRRASVYYLFNPLPGTNLNVTSDTPVTNWVVQSYTLAGVDTGVTPLAGSSGGSAASTSFTVAGCPNLGFAAASANWSSSSPGTSINISATNSGAAVGTVTFATNYNSGLGGTAGMGYINGLTPGGSDTFAAIAGGANKYGFAVAIFTPTSSGTPPIVGSPTKSAVASTSATLGATVVSDGTVTITDYGVVWGTSTNPTTADHKVSAGGSPALGTPFTVNVTGLPTATAIHYRGYAVNSKGVSYSSDDYFTTSMPEPVGQASGVTFRSVGDTGINLSWTRGSGSYCLVLANPAAPVDADPVDGITYTANSEFGSGSLIGTSNYVVYLGTGTNVTVASLATNAAYYFAVYELNGFGGGENYRTAAPAAGGTNTAAHVPGATYYSGAATGDPMSLKAWWTQANGTGYHPPDFVGGDTFVIQSGHTYIPTNTASATWVVNGTNAGTAATLQINTNGTLWLDSGTASLSLKLGGNLIQNGLLQNVTGRGSTLTFTSDGSWTGSGDLNNSQLKLSVVVNSGVRLNAAGINAPGIRLKSGSSTVKLQVGGTLDMGALTVNGSSNLTATFVATSGATLITAHPGGIGSYTNGSLGMLLNFVPGAVTFSTNCNFVFNGGTAQVTDVGLPTTVSNLTVNNSAGVTLSQPTAINGALYIQAGVLHVDDTNTTAGQLTFDGTTYQAAGTWGSTSSSAANKYDAFFGGTGYVSVLVGGSGTPPPQPTSGLHIIGTSLVYTGGYGSQYVLLASTNVAQPLASWDRVWTNYTTPGNFTLPVSGATPKKFFIIKSE